MPTNGNIMQITHKSHKDNLKFPCSRFKKKGGGETSNINSNVFYSTEYIQNIIPICNHDDGIINKIVLHSFYLYQVL